MAALAIEAAPRPDPSKDALSALEALAKRADAMGDPIAGVLHTLTRLHAAQQHMLTAMEEAASRARAPIDTDALERAVRDGIRAHAGAAVRALNWRNTLAACAAVAVAVIAGLGGGWIAAQNQMVPVPEIRGAVPARDAAMWINLINMNPDVANCRRIEALNKQPGREACALWIKAQ